MQQKLHLYNKKTWTNLIQQFQALTILVMYHMKVKNFKTFVIKKFCHQLYTSIFQIVPKI